MSYLGSQCPPWLLCRASLPQKPWHFFRNVSRKCQSSALKPPAVPHLASSPSLSPHLVYNFGIHRHHPISFPTLTSSHTLSLVLPASWHSFLAPSRFHLGDSVLLVPLSGISFLKYSHGLLLHFSQVSFRSAILETQSLINHITFIPAAPSYSP